MIHSTMVVLLLIVLITLPSQTHAGIILGFEPVWEDGATLGAPVVAGSFRDAVTGMEFVAVKGGHGLECGPTPTTW